MNKRDNEYPGWLLWIMDNGFVVTMILLLSVLCVAGVAIYLDQRIDSLETRLATQPPPSYQPPDLESMAADEVESAEIAVDKLVYLPVYSHVYYLGGRPYSLEATISIRNTDVDDPIYIRSVRYYDTEGELAKAFLDSPIRLRPLQSLEYLIEQRDSTGGSGANFLIDWFATSAVDEPIIEAVMVGASGTQSIGFTTTGKTVTRAVEP